MNKNKTTKSSEHISRAIAWNHPRFQKQNRKKICCQHNLLGTNLQQENKIQLGLANRCKKIIHPSIRASIKSCFYRLHSTQTRNRLTTPKLQLSSCPKQKIYVSICIRQLPIRSISLYF